MVGGGGRHVVRLSASLCCCVKTLSHPIWFKGRYFPLVSLLLFTPFPETKKKEKKENTKTQAEFLGSAVSGVEKKKKISIESVLLLLHRTTYVFRFRIRIRKLY